MTTQAPSTATTTPTKPQRTHHGPQGTTIATPINRTTIGNAEKQARQRQYPTTRAGSRCRSAGTSPTRETADGSPAAPGGNAAAAGAARPPAPEAGTAEIESPSPAGPASDPGADFIGVERGGTQPPD